MTRAKVYRKQGERIQKSEKVVEDAVEGIQNGTYKNAKEAAVSLGVPEKYWTIWRRASGQAKSRIAGHQRQQILNKGTECTLLDYITFLAQAGVPLSKRTIVPKVEALSGRKPSRRWVYRFLRRHPECTLGRPTGLDPKRARCFNFATVDAYFKKLQAVFDEHSIPWQNIHNLDEIGIQLGGGRKGTGELFFFSTEDKSRYKQKSDDLELVTIIESVCGNGTAPVKPCFVFAGKNMCEEWYDAEDGILLATTDNGWTADHVCLAWFEQNFIPAAKENADLSKPIVLLYDGHSSHASVEMIDLALANNIILFELPPHTTHRLQPCDVGVFGPLKREWNKRTETVLDETGEPIKAKDVVREYMAARAVSMKEQTIRQSFWRSGICNNESANRPKCDINRFKPSDFAPSITTSTELHLPNSFPVDLGDVAPAHANKEDGEEHETEGGEYELSSEEGSDDESDDEFDAEGNFETTSTADSERQHQASTQPRNTPSHSGHPFSASSSLGQSRTSRDNIGPGPSASSTISTSSRPLVAHYDDGESDGEDPRTITDVQVLQEMSLRLREERDRARAERDTATAHSILSGRSIKDLQTKLNAKRSSKKQGRNVAIGGRIVTTQEGRARAAAQKQARLEKENHTEEVKQRKLDAEVEKKIRRNRFGKAGMCFSGGLSSQKLASLVDIAWCMGIDETGTCQDLRMRISGHVNENPNLRDDPRFVGLWKRSTKRTLPSGTESLEAASDSHQVKRQHIEDVSNISLQLHSSVPAAP